MRQQFAIDLLDQADAEPADEAVEDDDDEGGDGEDEAAPEDEADSLSEEVELGGAAFAEPNDDTARVGDDGEAPCDVAGGAHLET